MQALEESQQAEICRRGEEMYEQHIRAKLGPDDYGKFLMLNIESGEYEIGTDAYAVSKRMWDRYPPHCLFLMRVGFPAAFKIGLRRQVVGP